MPIVHESDFDEYVEPYEEPYCVCGHKESDHAADCKWTRTPFADVEGNEVGYCSCAGYREGKRSRGTLKERLLRKLTGYLERNRIQKDAD